MYPNGAVTQEEISTFLNFVLDVLQIVMFCLHVDTPVIKMHRQ